MKVTSKKIVKGLLPPFLLTLFDWIKNYKKNAARKNILRSELYTPLYSPWVKIKSECEGYETIKMNTLLSDERLYTLFWAADRASKISTDFHEVSWVEVGVYRGGTARYLANLMGLLCSETNGTNVCLKLFDTFSGMPSVNEVYDFHRKGDFSDTSLQHVKDLIGKSERVHLYEGFVPTTFQGLEDIRCSLVHIDVDIYQSVLDSCDFLYSRMLIGGVMIFDDYGFPSCPGAREAVDYFFADKVEAPFVLGTGQAIIIKN